MLLLMGQLGVPSALPLNAGVSRRSSDSLQLKLLHVFIVELDKSNASSQRRRATTFSSAPTVTKPFARHQPPPTPRERNSIDDSPYID